MDGAQGDSIVLEEEIDPNYEPSEREVLEYASWLGMDLENEQDLFWIAREGLKAPLPENWKPCKTTDTEEIYYFNFATGQSTWDHPCDEFYRNLYDEHKKKRLQSKKSQDDDEKKKKEKEDVAELLGKKPGKKKKGSLSKAEPLGPPTLNKAPNPLEKKPLPGVGGAKLNSLSASSGALKPVGSLGRLKSESKADADEAGDDSDRETERRPSPRALSKPPLGSLQPRKSLPSSTASATSVLSKADSKTELETISSEMEQKKQRLAEEHAKALRDMELAHDDAVSALRKKYQKELDGVNDEEDTKLKQRKREFDKKLNDIENQYDREESNLLRERKEKLKRLEADVELTLSQKRQELEHDQQRELQRIKSRHETMMTELREQHETAESELKVKLGGDVGEKASLVEEVARLREAERRLESSLQPLRQQFEEATRDRESLQQQLTSAMKTTEELQRQLDAASVVHMGDKPLNSQCLDCERHERRVKELEERVQACQRELITAKTTISDLQAAAQSLQQKIDASFQDGERTSHELQTLRDVEKDLRAQLKQAETRDLDTVASWKSKAEILEQELHQLQQQRRDEAPTLASDNSEMDRLRTELADLHDQLSALERTNAQLKDQLLKAANEKRELLDQLNAKQDDSSGEKDTVAVKRLESLEDQVKMAAAELNDERVAKEAMARALDDLRHEKHDLEAAHRRLERELSDRDADAQRRDTEIQSLRRQITELAHEKNSSTEAAASDAETVVTQRMEIDRLNAALQTAQRERDSRGVRVKELETELDSLIGRTHQLEAERDSELSRAKKRETERDIAIQKTATIQTEMEGQTERIRIISQELSDAKAQLTKVKFREQSLLDKTSQLEEEVKQMEKAHQEKQAEVERLTRELRQRNQLLSEREATLTETKGENEALAEQLEQLQRSIAELKSRSSLASTASTGGATSSNASAELDELRIRVREKETKIAQLTQEKAQALEKHRQAAQRAAEIEGQWRSADADRARLEAELQSLTQEVSKWRERLDRKQKEVEQLQGEIIAAVNEKETTEAALTRERDEKRELLAQRTTLERARRNAEAEVDNLTTRLTELETTQRGTGLEAQTHAGRVRRLEMELESVSKELRGVQDERDELNARLRQQTIDQTALESKIRALRTECNDYDARCKTLEDDTTRLSDVVRRLEAQLEERDARLRRETEDRANQSKQLQAALAEKDDLELQLTSVKRKMEAADSRWKEHENVTSRGDFQLKVKMQQLEAERDGAVSGRERAEQHARTLEKEIVTLRDDLATLRSENESARTKLRALTTERDELQAVVLNAQSTASMASASRNGNRQSGDTAAMLVKLQLADVNKTELEQHLADVAAQLELATRRCALAEARCRDQAVAMEGLTVEISTLRSAMQQMHLSALETLPLVERLEYEHRKRTLKADFTAQLRDFEEREDHSLVRHKARVRAQHERQLDELGAELERKRQSRVETEERLTSQLLDQLRHERELQAKEVRQQAQQQLLEIERDLRERQDAHIKELSAAIRKEEETFTSRLRDARQVQREEELTQEFFDQQRQSSSSPRLTVKASTDARALTPVKKATTGKQQKRDNVLKVRIDAVDNNRPYGEEEERSEGEECLSDQELQARRKSSALLRQSRSRSRRRTHREATTRSPRRLRRHMHQSAVDDSTVRRWRQRLDEESALLDKARHWVATQKSELKRHADKLKRERREWQRDARMSGSTSQRTLLADMRTAIDRSTVAWNESVRHVRDREKWLERREAKLERMRSALRVLDARSNAQARHRRRSRSRSRSHRFAEDSDASSNVSSSSSLVLSSPSSADGDVSDRRVADATSALNTLQRLDEELVSDVSDFSEELSLLTDPRTMATRAMAVHPTSAVEVAPSFRYPLNYASTFDTSPSVLSTRWLQQQSSRHSAMGPSWPRPRQGMSMPLSTSSSTVSRVARPSTSRARVTDDVVQRQISRWAKSREQASHAATRQASWLSDLCQEVRDYGRAATNVLADPRSG
ncbi:hypothetical protein PINS_up007267 [Pythium insidiosum]|nr:hypothetical protein PINS_up007267 [Pythium insidiosum]